MSENIIPNASLVKQLAHGVNLTFKDYGKAKIGSDCVSIIYPCLNKYMQDITTLIQCVMKFSDKTTIDSKVLAIFGMEYVINDKKKKIKIDGKKNTILPKNMSNSDFFGISREACFRTFKHFVTSNYRYTVEAKEMIAFAVCNFVTVVGQTAASKTMTDKRKIVTMEDIKYAIQHNK
ncbi:histone-like transcription factor CBF/NF-Y [lymphocystis disease virus-China]|uniref:Transcription factor CBF/NF-Y/archaeal histone domain-containing protein n=2 Tax=Lymphocystis disease virus 2 TaxID=159183 RepID=A0A6F8WZX3_9VIRU|nr:histone-like transcription factor CBF/NF-Y [lymphocystis disease virus-China]AAU10900.1 histone-like transcription factor CBF/NF-Y [lymphocystis disease virus-China]BCB67442.1 hypothetical protein [Lymphocystis disease virus 2]